MDSKQWQLLKNDYLRRLRGYLGELMLFDHLLNQQPSAQQLKSIENLAHRLAGSGAAYGFSELSVMAKALELLLQGLRDDLFAESHPAVREALHSLIGHIELCIGNHAAPALPQPMTTAEDIDQPATNCPTIIIADDDPAIGMDLMATLSGEGFRVQVVEQIQALAGAIEKFQPLAVICDVIFPEGEQAGVEYFKKINESRLPPLPVIFISSQQGFDARLACARAGGSHFFSKPLDKAQLVQALRDLVGFQVHDPYRILLVDDDETLLALYSETLEHAGYRVFCAHSAREGLTLLSAEDPEAILLDIHLPDCSGLELGKIIRQHERFAQTPILFMSADTRADVQMAAVRLAGDEFISKPIEPWRLLMVVEPRVKRSRLIRNPLTLNHAGMLSSGETYDPLTALPNLRYLRNIIEERLSSGDEKIQLCVVKIDIDHFHHINEVYGHYQADRLLQQVAWEISHCLHYDDILCRESGDEFYVLLISPVSVNNTKTIIGNISAAIGRVKVSYNDNLHLTASFGVAAAPQDSRNATDLVAHADTALFHAKNQSDNRVSYFDFMLQKNLLHQFKLENDVRKIFDKQQLLVYYQPIVNVKHGSLSGFEALIRWRHPQRGILSPDQFVHSLEKQGLISRLTEWVLNAALAQLHIWQSQGRFYPVHINISASDLEHKSFPQTVADLLQKHAVEPRWLVLELTESTLIKNWDAGGRLLKRLRAKGIQLAIDDFGTGYSSLSYLNRFPVNTLKIDRSFINDWRHQKDERLISAIISLSKAMGFGVVAEGVEDQQQLAFLQQLNCDEYQGYLFSRPLPAEDIAAMSWFLPT